MKIGIVGAGFAGLSTAKVLREIGHDVVVWEKAPDVGGVWSATRRYPGLRTQNDKGTYSLSDQRMPRDYPEWPSGEQVQAYLQSYAERFGLTPHVNLSCAVEKAEPVAGGGWDVTTPAGVAHVDHLVLASGIFSRPFVPTIEGLDTFVGLGGQLLPAGDLHSLDQVAGKHAVVLGYGKSACDVTVEVATRAASTTVVARELLWKVPRKIRGVLNFKYLLLTRMGEGLFRYRRVTGMEKVLHAGDSRIANSMVGSVQKVTTKQLRLTELGLVPPGRFSDIARSTVSLVTEGFFDGVAGGSIAVKRDTVISRFVDRDGEPHAELSTGEVIPADIVLAATGWTQDIPFLPSHVMERLVDADGDYLLYRQIHPINVDDLSFAGYNSSFFSPLSAEMSAVWIGSYLGGNHTLPSAERMLALTRERLAWMRERTGGKHARGTNVIPFSMHNIDEVLSDVGLDVSRFTKLAQWLAPVKPGSYRRITPKLARRLARIEQRTQRQAAAAPHVAA